MGTREELTLLLDEADRELELYKLLPKHAQVYGYPPAPMTPEKALACLLTLGDGALDQVAQSDDPAEQRAAYQQAALAYKYAYLLRNAGVQPDLDLAGDAGIAAFAHVVADLVSRQMQPGPSSEHNS
jgi:hypothetical protein